MVIKKKRCESLPPKKKLAVEVQYRKRVMANLRKRAAQMGFDLIERSPDDAPPCTA